MSSLPPDSMKMTNVIRSRVENDPRPPLLTLALALAFGFGGAGGWIESIPAFGTGTWPARGVRRLFGPTLFRTSPGERSRAALLGRGQFSASLLLEAADGLEHEKHSRNKVLAPWYRSQSPSS